MASKSKPIIQTKSSQKVAKFLDSNKLHKKDFAEMIGVTLSYVYNLIDNTIPFSTRSTTLERIATVMDIEPEEFEEYKIPQEPILIDESIEFLQDSIKLKGLSVVSFLKSFPRKKRLEIVDILRGASPLPIDFKELSMIAQVLDLKKDELYPLWENRLKQVLEASGMNINANLSLINTMFDCAKKFINIEKR
jgi:transcriptional regulator with XRE-family HTH domain